MEADTAYYGRAFFISYFERQGFTSIDNYDTTNGFAFVYKKNSLATFTFHKIRREYL
jgi:hypothetical protein